MAGARLRCSTRVHARSKGGLRGVREGMEASDRRLPLQVTSGSGGESASRTRANERPNERTWMASSSSTRSAPSMPNSSSSGVPSANTAESVALPSTRTSLRACAESSDGVLAPSGDSGRTSGFTSSEEFM